MRKNVTDTQTEKGVTFDCLLNCLDGIQRNDGVFVIITSNRSETIDPAIGCANDDGSASRPGRIDRIIEIKDLNMTQKEKIARVIMKGFEEFIPDLLEIGKNENGACFVNRCRIMAEKVYWDNCQGNKNQEDDCQEEVTLVK